MLLTDEVLRLDLAAGKLVVRPGFCEHLDAGEAVLEHCLEQFLASLDGAHQALGVSLDALEPLQQRPGLSRQEPHRKLTYTSAGSFAGVGIRFSAAGETACAA
jgi:hypothetical protein